MIKTKKQMFIVIGVFILIVLLGTASYAFFNFTRTGGENSLGTGRIYFNTTETRTVSLTQIFPVDENDLDPSTLASTSVRIVGDTTYSGGEEYLVTLTDIHNTINNKTVPIHYIATYTASSGKTVGTGSMSDNYFANRGGSTNLYTLSEEGIVEEGKEILIGFLKEGTAGIDGVLTVKAWLSKDDIAISDTYDGTESDNMGTTTEWVGNRVVLTTTEWNGFSGNGALSFKIKTESNEGTWVEEHYSRNDMGYLPSAITDYKTSITEVNFVRISEEEINTHANLIDLTANGGEGVVKAWIDGTKLYIASPGETYFPGNSGGFFQQWTAVTQFNFNNVNGSNLFFMSGMFQGCSSLTTIDLSGWGSDNLTVVNGLFGGCSSLTTVNMRNFNFGTTSFGGVFANLSNLQSVDFTNANFSGVTDMSTMFVNCSNLTSVNFSGIDTSHVTNMSVMFQGCSSLTTIDISSFNTSSVTNMNSMFTMGTYSNNNWSPINNSLTTIYVGNNWSTSAVATSTKMFYNCTSLVGGNGTKYIDKANAAQSGDDSYMDKTYAVIDDNTHEGYLTLKTN